MRVKNHLRSNGRLYITILITAVLTIFLVNIVQGVTGSGAEPGTEANPLVSKDYVDARIDELLRQIQAIQQGGNGGNALFQVVELSSGQQLIAGASTEIIVRSGTATAISGINGDGLSDLTTDDITKGNLVTGQVIPPNHLILVARDDGRGLKAVSDKVFLLVKGPYTIK